MSRLRLSLLGAPRVERDGAPIEVDARKAIALLAYLVVTGQAHRRDALAALLWPEYDQTSARASLRRTLSALSKGRAGGWLPVDRETIGLSRTDDVWVDVEAFRHRLAEVESHGQSHGHPAAGVCPACRLTSCGCSPVRPGADGVDDLLPAPEPGRCVALESHLRRALAAH